MKKCDVCGATTILPEKLGDSCICKKCFIKVNGPIWKYRKYEKYDSVEKNRVKVVEKAELLNFPKAVIEGINVYFDEQEKQMMQCDVCGNVVQTLHNLSQAKICKKCFAKINNSEWKQEDYLSNEDVDINKEKVIKIALKHGYPQNVIDGISDYFDSKKKKGLYRIVHGGLEQTLKVFETHCVLVTYDDFDKNEISKKYARLNGSAGSILSGGAETVVKGLLSGGVVGAGISLATSAVVNAASNAISSKSSFKLIKGGIKIYYKEYDRVEYHGVGDGEMGFLRFRNSSFGGNPSEDVVFFFEYDGHMKKVYEYVSEKIRSAHEVVQPINNGMQSASVADELLKFKNLLDMGAITQEEYEIKKKELLKL